MSMRERLTELDIQLIWLSHPRTGDVIESYGIINNTLLDDGETVEIYFPFSSAINEELTHVVLGEDYVIQTDEPLGTTKIDVAIDGTYGVFTGVPIKILSVEGAIARSRKGAVRVLPQLGESDRMAIAYCPEKNRFARTNDLKNSPIELFRAQAVYPRWVERRRELKESKVGNRLEDQPLEKIELHLYLMQGADIYYRIYLAQVNRVPTQECRTVGQLQPKDARRVKLHSLVLTANHLIQPEWEIQSHSALII